MRGRYFWNRRTEDSLRRSIEYFQQAIATDPDYALAYAGLADTYALLASFSVETGQQAHSNAKAAALKAIQLDPSLAEPHASLGMISFFSDWDGAAAEQEFRRSIALQPNYATAHHWYALDLAAMGRFPEALSEAERAEQLDPLSLIIVTNVGWVLISAINTIGPSPNCKRRSNWTRNSHAPEPAWESLISGKTKLRRPFAGLEQALRLSGQDPYIAGVLGDAQARAGDQGAARRILKELTGRAKTHYVPPFSFALVYLGLGERENAMRWLLKAYDDHSTSMVYAKIDPILDPDSHRSAVTQILGRMKF